MLNHLFINILLLISFTFVGGHIAKELPEKISAKWVHSVLLGASGGALGILMMIYSIQVVGTNTLLDLRSLAVVMISSIGGFTATSITGVILALYRIGHYGLNQSSIFGVIHICLYITIFHLINKKIKSPAKNWFVKLVAVIAILVSTFLYLLRNVENNYLIIAFFTVVVLGTGTLEYYLLKYAKHSNELYRIYKNDSTNDFLTGLNNTRQFDKLLNSSFERAIQNNEKLSCLMIDIDHFKKVNDTYGHAVGDIVLKELAEILKANCRSFDFIGRVGGEEFCILLLDCPLERSFEIGSRIRNAVKDCKISIGEGRTISITVSVGIASYPETVDNLEEIKHKADMALYKAKHTGRDRVCNHVQCIEI